MIEPKTIMLTRPADFASRDVASFSQADEVLHKYATDFDPGGERLTIRAIVVFTDHFVWASSLTVTREDTNGKDFIQRAIKADWEFNAGVRPTWWPHDHEADRMWGVHYREDRDNGRAEMARMRLERYDLEPVALTELPLRDSSSP